MGGEGGQNAATSAQERIHTCGSAASAAIVREFRYLLGEPMVGELAFRQGTEILAKAFRQVPLHYETLRYNVVCAWSSEAGKWQFFQMLAMPFGLKAAVLQFNRVSALVTALARRVLGIPCLLFYDDFKHSELLASVPSARDSLTDLITWLGLTKDPTAMVKFLGTLEDASPPVLLGSTHSLCVAPLSASRLCVRSSFESVVLLCCTWCELARLRGKLTHLAGTMAGRVGASLTHQCTYHITEDITAPSSALRREIDWVLALLARAPWRLVHLSMPHQGVTVISDASWSVESALPQSRLCFWVFAASRPPFGRVLDVPGWFIDVLPPRETHIMVMELVAAFLPLLLYPGLFKCTAVTLFIDNQSALMSLVKGGSRAVDLNHLSMVTHATLLTVEALAWWEYVPSASNAADGGSQTGHRDALARTLGVPLVHVVFPQFMLDIMRTSPVEVVDVIGRRLCSNAWSVEGLNGG